MKLIDLNGSWKMYAEGEVSGLNAEIPGSVAATLLAHGRIDDPYIGGNEKKVLPVFEKDYRFEREFLVDETVLSHDKMLLCCDGLDTIAAIRLNGQLVAETCNMHRRYVFDVKNLLIPDKNVISVQFHSPLKYLEEHPSQTGKRYATIRKAACMFGWDWGIELPDSGIWRDIYIEGFDTGRIQHVGFQQRHQKGRVDLTISVDTEIWNPGARLLLELISPDGTQLASQTKTAASNSVAAFHCSVENPMLWWPVGYGGQPLYSVKLTLQKDDIVLDSAEKKIGLRTLVLDRSKRERGSQYGFVVNGVPVFFRGSNMIIEDAIISRTDDTRWETLIGNCLKSNMNGIRVWGGAYYPPDIFYELCDQHGLMVYQDFMFACTFYGASEPFLDNVTAEVRDNLSRIAHHACIALYCGNNEIDCIYTVMCSKEPETVALRLLFVNSKPFSFLIKTIVWRMYKKLFLKIIPGLCEEYAPDTSYVHSSPSIKRPGKAKSFFEYLSDGDMHYYLQYNDNAPYQKLRNFRVRFMTEMGFQSYPSMKTIHCFADESDQSPYSDVMYAHQKCNNGNEAIELYMKRDYGVPTNFEDYVYLSQLQAGEIMKYSVEHLRRDSAYCRGMVIWQLNDCWPVVSWSGIDYYGRWKAQQYYTKRFYAPVLVSALEEDAEAGMWVSNDSPDTFKGTLRWYLRNSGSNILSEGETDVVSVSGSSSEVVHLNFEKELREYGKNKLYLEYELCDAEGVFFGQGTVLFTLPRDFDFAPVNLTMQCAETPDAYMIELRSESFVKGLALDTTDGDCIFSDNIFDLSAGITKTIWADKRDMKNILSLAQLKDELYVNSLNNVMLRTRIKIREGHGAE